MTCSIIHAVIKRDAVRPDCTFHSLNPKAGGLNVDIAAAVIVEGYPMGSKVESSSVPCSWFILSRVERAYCPDILPVVVGPDDAIVDGIEGYFRGKGAEIEGSKTYAKDLMRKYGIPTADYRSFSRYDDARGYLDRLPGDSRVVIKVDGLAAGKGVFGIVGQSVVIEEYIEGEEISVLTFSDGKTFKSLPPGQDRKRIFDENQGPNTGGMGVYAPLPFVSPGQMEDIERDVVGPTLEGVGLQGRPFVGMLFTGVMLTAKGPRVLEYNARFGDPETQTMMMLLGPECDVACIMPACCTGKLPG
ncbi:hypothetical protein FZEAL_3463 [Fusarium zealandicum]|uniref:ATP-grasp domain-containing protein n=1 Tax=Fusarium zealandicum TaxID=1053134 RepID=A0A8H4UNK7_9HYPO|nr:hypothetical protein FZEAL_3463 [Fusarium zealandicum]